MSNLMAMQKLVRLLTEILSELKGIHFELKTANNRLEQIGTAADEAASLLDDVIDEIGVERYGNGTDQERDD